MKVQCTTETEEIHGVFAVGQHCQNHFATGNGIVVFFSFALAVRVFVFQTFTLVTVELAEFPAWKRGACVPVLVQVRKDNKICKFVFDKKTGLIYYCAFFSAV